MSKLAALRNKPSKEVVRVLSVLASSLLPNPGISDAFRKTNEDRQLADQVLSEIRSRLRVRENDQSIKAQSQIYAFLSQEMSAATLTSEAIRTIEDRLGNTGELHSSRYEIKFVGSVLERLEAMGNRRSNLTEVVVHPDQVVHLKSKYLPSDRDPRLTISLKAVPTKRVEDRFILVVLSVRHGRAQHITDAYRVYESDVRIDDPSDPINVVKSFASQCGLTFRIGDQISNFMLNEAIALKGEELKSKTGELVKPVQATNAWSYVFFGGESNMRGPEDETVAEVILAFAYDHIQYVASLRKHHVKVDSNFNFGDKRSSFFGYSVRDLSK